MKEKTLCGRKSEVDEYGNLGFGLTFLSFRSLPHKFSLVYGHHHDHQDHQDHQDHHRPLACHPHPRHKFSAISQLITTIIISFLTITKIIYTNIIATTLIISIKEAIMQEKCSFFFLTLFKRGGSFPCSKIML